jgi:hypothetical protein
MTSAPVPHSPWTPPQVLLANIDAIDWGLLPRALMGLLALLCGNGYIVGINQIYDVDIDAVNKPFLPVAAGEHSCNTAQLWQLGLAAKTSRQAKRHALLELVRGCTGCMLSAMRQLMYGSALPRR